MSALCQKRTSPVLRQRAESERPWPKSWACPRLSRGLARRACFLHLVDASGRAVIDEAVDRYATRHQRITTDALDVLNHALGQILDRVPVDEMAVDRAATMFRIGPLLAVEVCCFEIVLEQIAHDFISEGQHAAVGVMDDEPLVGAEQLMRDHQRANSIVACAAAGIADDMGIAFGQASIFGRIEPCVHAGKNSKVTRWWHSKLAFVPKTRSILAVGF